MFRTILVHVDGGAQQDSRLRAAALLANADGAHLVGSAATGISWMDLALLSSATTAAVPAATFDQLRERAAGRLRDFTAQAARLGVASVEARLIEDVPAYALLLQARYADLVVLSQDSQDGSGGGGGGGEGSGGGGGQPARLRRLPEHVALHGARPVLVVPGAYQDAPIPGTVVAGWDGSVQAMRAIAAALPLLVRAPAVKLVLVNAERPADLHGEQPGADMALYLARHGVAVEVVGEHTTATVGNTLMALACDCGAGLMVCGAYGHSRYREWVLGGVTRELLERAPVPLLIAH